MKKVLYSLCLLLTALSLSSCFKSGLEDLPAFSDANILSVSRVEYRYVSDETSPSSGQQLVKNVTLSHSAAVSNENATLTITVNVPDNFPQAELPNLSASALVVSLNISTAARIAPIEGSATLGIPADWSKANKYMITAADGTQKEWTITLILNK